MRGLVLVGVLALALSLASSAAWADTVTAADRGWYLSNGHHLDTHTNTYTGRINSNTYHSFFVFDLSSLTETVTAATLRVNLGAYYGSDAAQTFDAFDYGGTIADLVATSAAGSGTGLAIFNDLGGGNAYGTATVTSSDVGSVIEIELSAQALSDINGAHPGYFALGLRTRSVFNFPAQQLEGLSLGSSTHELLINPPAVPEPTTLALFGLGAGALALRRRNRKLA